MMAGLFVLYLIVIILALMKLRRTSLIAAIITLAFCIAMFVHHATVAIPVRL